MPRFGDAEKYLRNECLPLIRAHGWMCAGHEMPSGQLASTITYTAGLTEAGIAELAMVGLPYNNAAVLLNFLARLHLENTLREGSMVPMPNATELKLVDAPGLIGPVARALYGRRVRFLQAMWPDGRGLYPTDPGWPADLHAQPVFDVVPPGYLAPVGDGLVGALDAVHQRGE
jgi:hypothetical protein